MSVLERHHVSVSGPADAPPLVFAHGFGCDQHMWRYVAPAFEADHRVVLFDHMGCGASDLRGWDPDRYRSLDAYAEDVLAICHALELRDVTFVGHSVSAMIGVLAEVREPDLFARLVLVGPSPRYLDDPPYVGGFSVQDIEGLLESMAGNYLGWSHAMAPMIMGNPERPGLGEELTESFCRSDPDIARQFARTTFLSDNRAELAEVSTPTLVLQCSGDRIAPTAVGEYVRDQVPGSTYRLLRATGHCPNLSAPEETTQAIRAFLDEGVVTR